MQKRMFKVLSPIDKRNGSTYWLRCGTAFTNKDDSINIYLDAMPKEWRFTLRELDEEDLRRREPRTNDGGMPPMPPMPLGPDLPPQSDIPF